MDRQRVEEFLVSMAFLMKFFLSFWTWRMTDSRRRRYLRVFPSLKARSRLFMRCLREGLTHGLSSLRRRMVRDGKWKSNKAYSESRNIEVALLTSCCSKTSDRKSSLIKVEWKDAQAAGVLGRNLIFFVEGRGFTEVDGQEITK